MTIDRYWSQEMPHASFGVSIATVVYPKALRGMKGSFFRGKKLVSAHENRIYSNTAQSLAVRRIFDAQVSSRYLMLGNILLVVVGHHTEKIGIRHRVILVKRDRPGYPAPRQPCIIIAQAGYSTSNKTSRK